MDGEFPEQSLRDTIAAELEKVEPVSAPPEPSPSPLPPEAVVPADAESPKPGRTAGRPRDEQGRLLPGKVEKQPVVEAPAVEPPKAIQRPSSWKKEHWESFDKVAKENPALAEYINQREGEYAKGVSTYKQEWEQAKPLLEALAPYQQTMQQHNVNAADMVGKLAAAHHRLALGQPQEKLAMFQQLARDYQLPVQLAVQNAQGQWELLQAQNLPPPPAPDVRALVKAELTQQRMEQEVNTFVQQTDKYPHFETVKPTMIRLLESGLAPDLTSAYEKALRMNDELWQAQQAQQAEHAAAEKLAAQKAKVTRARSNAVSPGTATPGPGGATGEKGLRDIIADQIHEIGTSRV